MKLPLSFIAIDPQPNTLVEAISKSGDVAKGSRVQVTMIRDDGKIAVENSEHWHSMRAFAWFGVSSKLRIAPVVAANPANDNAE